MTAVCGKPSLDISGSDPLHENIILLHKQMVIVYRNARLALRPHGRKTRPDTHFGCPVFDSSDKYCDLMPLAGGTEVLVYRFAHSASAKKAHGSESAHLSIDSSSPG